jgi:hypothetical protein
MSVSRRMRWAGHVARMGGRNSYKVLVRKPGGKRPFGRLRRKWEDRIKIRPRKIGWKVVDWIQLAQDRDRWRAVVNTSPFSGSAAAELVSYAYISCRSRPLVSFVL